MKVRIIIEDGETGACSYLDNIKITVDLYLRWERAALSRCVAFPSGCMLGDNFRSMAAQLRQKAEDFRDERGFLDGQACTKSKQNQEMLSCWAVGMTPADF